MNADVLVVGLGAVGSAVLYQLAQRGVGAIGIDRHSPPHDLGSSHGETRITRQGVGEGNAYVDLAVRAHEIWRELEERSKQPLLLQCGALIIGRLDGKSQIHNKPDFVRRSIAAAEHADLLHEVLTSSEIRRRFPQFNVAEHEYGYYEPGGGLVYPERCIAVQLAEAERLGARIARNETVVDIKEEQGSVRVTTDRAAYSAARVVVAAGAWTPALVGAPASAFALQPQVLHWFECGDPAAYDSARCPVYIWSYGTQTEESFYGFPIAAGAPTQGVKVAMETTVTISGADALDRRPDPALSAAMFSDHIADRLLGVSPRILKSAACLYTTTPDGDFGIGRLPSAPRTWIVSACSGHGFKHSPATGECVAAAICADDPTLIPAAFGLERGALGW